MYIWSPRQSSIDEWTLVVAHSAQWVQTNFYKSLFFLHLWYLVNFYEALRGTKIKQESCEKSS